MNVVYLVVTTMPDRHTIHAYKSIHDAIDHWHQSKKDYAALGEIVCNDLIEWHIQGNAGRLTCKIQEVYPQ